MGGLFFFATLTIYWNSVLHLQNPPPHAIHYPWGRTMHGCEHKFLGEDEFESIFLTWQFICHPHSPRSDCYLPGLWLNRRELITGVWGKERLCLLGRGKPFPGKKRPSVSNNVQLEQKERPKKNLKQECVCFVTSARPKKLAGPVVVERFCDGAGWNCEQIAVINTVYWYGRGDRSSLVNGRKGKTLLRLDAFSQ